MVTLDEIIADTSVIAPILPIVKNRRQVVKSPAVCSFKCSTVCCVRPRNKCVVSVLVLASTYNLGEREHTSVSIRFPREE